MRRRDAGTAVQAQLDDREIHHLRSDEPDVEHVRSGVRRALDERGSHGRRGQPHVSTDGDGSRLEVLDVGTTDAVCAILVELVSVEAADVVRLEDGGIEHGQDASARDGAAVE